MYGPYINEELLGRALAGRRDGVVIATKCGFVRDPADPGKREINDRPEYIRRQLRGQPPAPRRRHHRPLLPPSVLPGVSVARGRDRHAVDLVHEGKIHHIGLSEVSAATLTRAHAIHPVSALQTRYSLWSREPEENGALEACRTLGVAFVPYSPLGRGFLSGGVKRVEDFAPDDVRQNMPRFKGGNLREHELVRTLEALAHARGATAAELALAWVMAQGEGIIPIPGTTRSEHLDELIDATAITLSATELDAIERAFPKHAVAGDRYMANMRAFSSSH